MARLLMKKGRLPKHAPWMVRSALALLTVCLTSLMHIQLTLGNQAVDALVHGVIGSSNQRSGQLWSSLSLPWSIRFLIMVFWSWLLPVKSTPSTTICWL